MIGTKCCCLMASSFQVIAYEVDPRMVAELQKRVMGTPSQKKLEIIMGDVIKVLINVIRYLYMLWKEKKEGERSVSCLLLLKRSWG